MFGELIFQACRQLSVGFKNITNDRYFHNKLLYSASICWTYSSRPVSIECPYCSPQAGHGAKKCSPLTAGKVCPHWEHLRVMGTEVGSRRKRLEGKGKGFRDDVGECSISYPYQQQAMDVVLFHLFADNG